MHTGCPVLQGIKWTGTVWIHTAPFRPESLSRESELQSLYLLMHRHLAKVACCLPWLLNAAVQAAFACQAVPLQVRLVSLRTVQQSHAAPTPM
jgi:hypothetical protein